MTLNQVQLKKVAYQGWPNCYQLSNGLVDLIVTTDVGPRIIRFGFTGGGNEFREFPEMMGQTGGDTWLIYGGHRLWHAPEEMPRTYYPDNAPVALEEHDGLVRLIQQPEPTTGIQKEIDLRLMAGEARAIITHRLRNTGLWAIELAPWALTVMAPGGVAVIPLPPRGSHAENLQPTSTLTLWAYMDMADPRWTWGRSFVLLRQDPTASGPQKIGARVPDGWTAYARDGRLFVKMFEYKPDARYPDFDSPVEVYTDAQILEVETLGPLSKLAPGASVEHVEQWFLFKDVPAPRDDAAVNAYVVPKVRQAKGRV